MIQACDYIGNNFTIFSLLISYLPGKDEDLSSHVKIAACFFPGVYPQFDV